MRISGVSLPAYWIGNYISDVVFSLITTISIIILMQVYKADVPGGWILILLMTFTNPIFLYVMSSFFTNANIARQGILFTYIFVGVLVPFILPLIQLVNQTLFDVCLIVSYLFNFIPVFAVVNGYIKIALRIVQWLAWS